MNKFEMPETLPVSGIIEEAEGIRTMILSGKLNVKPGQFAMIWLPGVDAKPIAISYQDESSFGITISSMGEWSERIMNMKEGDFLGVMGPYGNSFNLEGERTVMLGGGYGVASLMILAEQASKEKINNTIIIGAKTEKQLIYRDRLKNLEGAKSVFTTDDGSFGEQGFCTDALDKLLKNEKVDKVFAVGPELMEKKAAELCRERGVKCEISIERYMKCGFGVCGACCMDEDGRRVCVEGTVFDGNDALNMEEFGKHHRDGTATKRYLR